MEGMASPGDADLPARAAPPDEALAAAVLAALADRGALAPASVDEGAEAFAARLLEELRAAATRWPALPEAAQAAAAFAAYLVERELPRGHLADLLLAWWCSTGAPAALEAFEHELGGELAALAARFRDLAADELRQQLRIKLFLGSERSPPRILDYRGAGPLRNWLRVTAVRTFVDAQRASSPRRRERELSEVDLLGDPRGEHVRAEVAAAVKRGFAQAVAALEPRQRVFLRHVYVDQHTLDQIASTYSIHRATVARVLAAARSQLVGATRAAVIDELGGDSEELSTAIRALEDHVELSLSRVLAAS